MMYVILPTQSRALSHYNNFGEFATLSAASHKGFNHVGEVNASECPTVVYLSSDRHIAHYMDLLTKTYPGWEFGVFKLQQVGVRQPGALITKEVSEKGILPK